MRFSKLFRSIVRFFEKKRYSIYSRITMLTISLSLSQINQVNADLFLPKIRDIYALHALNAHLSGRRKNGCLFEGTWWPTCIHYMCIIYIINNIQKCKENHSYMLDLHTWLVLLYLILEHHGTSIAYLVGGFPSENMSQLGVLFPIYGKIKGMFQTTKQICIL